MRTSEKKGPSRHSRTWKGRGHKCTAKCEKEGALESRTPDHVKKAASVKKGVCAFRSKYMPQTPDDPITTPEDGKYALRRI